MPKQEESKTVGYTKDQMFDLVADIDRYDEFLPWCNNSKVIDTKKEGNINIIIADGRKNTPKKNITFISDYLYKVFQYESWNAC